MAGSSAPWIGSAYLFLQSTCKTIVLPSLYESSQKKPSVFKALTLALADSTGSMNGVEILKVHCSHPHLIVQLKFLKQENCRQFLRSYREGALQKSLQNHLQLSLATTTVPLETELKAGNEHLDKMLKDEDRCLECIYREKPDRLRDEEITELEECLKSLIVHQSVNNNVAVKDCASLNSPSLPFPSPGSSLSPQVTFVFQGQQFEYRANLGLAQAASRQPQNPRVLPALPPFQPTEHSPQTTTRNLPSSCPRNGSKWVALCRRTAGLCVILSSITWPSNMIERDYTNKPIRCFSDLSTRRARRPR
ncbi:tumor necrosis factor receptor type 1-associated DEATH domain protein isoform X2 [Caloenas nicobarica]|uniref:tumor necrosis factor receptor type 1-associated DEATH domain protein isoform X2 n=1 Tax=Caloenas nicobarica TaxID=187106 RepID=UPI0032B8095D